MNRIRHRLLAVALAMVAAPAAMADFEQTRLIELSSGSPLSDSVRSYQNQGYELSDGRKIIFGDWYRSDIPDITMVFLTPLSPDLGLTWGIGTGERGGQYEIQPSLRLGFHSVQDLAPDTTLVLSARAIIGGRLGERPCQAGYGDIGTYSVNCRLAATAMRPADTLDHLFDTPPPDRFSLSFRIRREF